ncbi:MAG: IPT/TIG domain-containing protein, partial [Treponema sp.]|nr:IPT/TIG domain-containing protein [Treponema sp.]
AQYVSDGDEVFPAVYAPGKIRVDRSSLPLRAPGQFRVAETDEGIISLRWQNTNGGRTAGYNLRIRDKDAETEYVWYTGNITSLTLPGYQAGQNLSFAAASVDDALRESPYTEAVDILAGQKRPDFNRPVIGEPRIRARGLTGGFTEGTIKVDIASYRESPDSSGYLMARYAGEEDAPHLMNLRFGGPVKITGSTVEIPWYMGIPDAMNPGIYEYAGEVINEANGALSAPFTLELTIRWPGPEILSVEPEEINGRDGQTLTIYGSGFVPGTKVIWQGEELVLAGQGNSSIILEALLPPQTRAGAYTLTVAGPDNQRASYPVEVVLPDWNLTLYTRTAETIPGGSLLYPLGVTGIDGFEDTVSFRVREQPPELDVSLPVIPAGKTGAVGIRVREDAAPGSYSTILEGGEGKVFELVTIVREDPPGPHLVSLSPPSAYPGMEIHLYGYGLGASGVLYLNDQALEITRWSGEEIVFTLPGTGTSGLIHAAAPGGISNSLPITVRNRGFSLHPGSHHVELSAGKDAVIPIYITGYADTVNLRAESEGPLGLSLDRISLEPNGTVNLTIRAGNAAGNGVRKVLIQGSSGNFEAGAEITVHIGDSFAIETSGLPEGLVDVSYYAKLKEKNAAGETEYRVSGGALPPGFVLNPQGELSGRTSLPGQYKVTIEARDGAGRTDARDFVILIVEEPWGQAGKDGGQSRAVGAELPAERQRAWSFDGKEPVTQLLAAEDRIIALSGKGITAVQAKTGDFVWARPGTYREMVYAGAALYALTGSGVLETLDLNIGTLLWTRDGIRSLSTDGTKILADTGSARLVIDAARGTLLERLDRSGDIPGKMLWKNGVMYEIGETGLIPVYGEALPWDGGERILAAVADTEGVLVATEKSLIFLDRDNRELKRIARPSSEEGAAGNGELELSLTGDGALILDTGYLSEYRREDLVLRWRRPASGSMAAGKEKAALAGTQGLMVLNRYTGETIWGDEEPYAGFVLYREKIFAAGTQGRIDAFTGPANIHAPDTVIQIRPEAPNGENGWYTLNPAVQIVSTDRETYVEETKIGQGDGTWEDASEPVILEDGEQQIRAYGVDSRGLRGEEALLYVKVDTRPPESTYALQELSPEPASGTPAAEESGSGWHKLPVLISLEGKDSLSGLDRIWTSRGVYGEPVLFAGQGIHTFTWYAIDRAGNREAPRSCEIKIDFEAPHTEIRASYDKGICQVEISAPDRHSGTALIEYRINGGGVEQYHEPLIFMQQGAYQIQYRAADRAGNYGPWQTGDIWVSPNQVGGSLIASASINGLGRLIMYHARNGMPVVEIPGTENPEFDRDRQEAMIHLPSYTLGGEYILWKEEDISAGEEAKIHFQVTQDVTVYLFLPRSAAVPAGWSFVEANVGINRIYYPGGTGVYMRRYYGGDWVELAGTPPGSLPPLILVQERGSIFAEIVIRREEEQNKDAGRGWAFYPEALITPWQYSRKLPLRKRWFVNTGDGWTPLEGNRWEPPPDPAGDSEEGSPGASAEYAGPGYLRFRLEVYTPDGSVEYRTEKTMDSAGLL